MSYFYSNWNITLKIKFSAKFRQSFIYKICNQMLSIIKSWLMKVTVADADWQGLHCWGEGCGRLKTDHRVLKGIPDPVLVRLPIFVRLHFLDQKRSWHGWFFIKSTSKCSTSLHKKFFKTFFRNFFLISHSSHFLQ